MKSKSNMSKGKALYLVILKYEREEGDPTLPNLSDNYDIDSAYFSVEEANKAVKKLSNIILRDVVKFALKKRIDLKNTKSEAYRLESYYKYIRSIMSKVTIEVALTRLKSEY